MTKKRPTSASPVTPVPSPRGGLTAERIVRLCRLLRLLGVRQKRETLMRRLKIDVRSFYRDLDSLRTLGIEVASDDGRYRLAGTVDEALGRLPFPDPQLTCGEAIALAKGRTVAHRKLKGLVEKLLG